MGDLIDCAPRRRAGRYVLPTLLAGTLSCAFSAGAAAQSNNDSFDVTVEPSQSQEQIVTQGASSLAGASLGLRTLERITAFSRGRRAPGGQNGNSEESSFSRVLTSALGRAFYAAVAGSGSGSDKELGADFSRLSSFADVSYAFGDHDTTVNTPGHDADTLSITAGVDYRVNPVVVVGAALAYQDTSNDFSAGVGALDVSGISLSGFGSWHWAETGYVDGILRFGQNDYDSRRRTRNGAVATGDTEGDEVALSLGAGYDFNRAAWTLGPTARINYTDVTIDGYRERSSGQALRYSDQDVESLNTQLGAQASRAFTTDFGVVLPQANLEWVHEFEDDGRRITARPAAGGAAFAVPVDALDSNYFRASLGTTVLLAHGRMFFARYEGEFGRRDLDSHTLSLGGRLEF